MTLGRSSSGAIKIKTDGGLRAVECACCGPTDFQPCRDCPPVSGNWTFSISGELVEDFIGEFQHPSVYCPSAECFYNGFPQNLPPRVCVDSWDAYSNNLLYQIFLYRFGESLNTCGWRLEFSMSGWYFPPDGDPCQLGCGGAVEILGNSPTGSYPFDCVVICDIFNPDGPPTQSTFTSTTTVTVA